MLPTFIVIGAMKCGTTSLYYYLDAHPDIGVSTQKETDFFLEPSAAQRERTWYESRFPTDKAARGECSPNYTKRHLFSGVAGRMSELVPGIKLVYMVRDPIDRTISHYVTSRVRGREHRPFSEAVRSDPKNNYRLTSKYFFQLEPYLEHFSADQLLVVSMEAMRDRRDEVLSRIHEFVGVSRRGDKDVPDAQFNVTARKRKRGPLYRWFSSLLSPSFKDAVRPYLPLRWVPGRSIPRPEPSQDLRDALVADFRDDVRALRRVTGQSFDRWSL